MVDTAEARAMGVLIATVEVYPFMKFFSQLEFLVFEWLSIVHFLVFLSLILLQSFHIIFVLLIKQITPGSDTEMMTVIHMTSPREPRIMTLEETLIMTPDQ